MATVVQTAIGAFSGTTATAIFSSPVTAGNAIIVLRTSWEFDESGSVRTYTVTDNKGGTNADYVAISDQYIDPLYSPLWSHQIWGIANSAGGSGTAVTVTASEAETGLILVAEISGLGSSLTVDGEQIYVSGSGTAVVGAAKTPSAAGIHLVLVGALSESPPAVTAAGSGWTLVGGGTSAEFRLAMLHRPAVNGVSQSAAATLSAAPDGWGLIHVVLLDAVGGAEEGDYTAGATAAASFSAVASASGTLSAGISGNSAFSGRAAALGAVTEAISAGDTDAAAQAAERAFSAQVSTDAQYAAIAQAAAAIQAGLEAGEQWAAVAAAEAGLTAGVELGASFASPEGAFTAALEAGTEAAAQFLGAVAAFGLLEAGASASDAFAAAARISASISDAAQFGASFTTASLNDATFSAASSLQGTFSALVAGVAGISGPVDVGDAYAAVSVALAAISAGVALNAVFSAVSSADVSIVGATASVRAIRQMTASVRSIRQPTASVRSIRPTATIN